MKTLTSSLNGESVATLALGSRPRQRGLQGSGPKGSSRVKARGSPGVKVRGSLKAKARRSQGVTSHIPGSVRSVREYEGMNPHTPKATPTFGDGVPMESRNFKEQFQGSKLNGLWHSLYHCKALRT
jgi:hypothetical protein